MKIYVASSWRCNYQPEAVRRLRDLGHEVYDFRGKGSGWGDEIKCGDCARAKDLAYPNPGKAGGYFADCPAHRGDGGFHWSEVDPEWQIWPSDIRRYLRGLEHPRAIEGFNRDMDALKLADACILVNPCGQSAHAELGWAAGAGKLTAAWCPEIREPDLMLKMAGYITSEWSGIELWLRVPLDL
jgi:hypothetical protein